MILITKDSANEGRKTKFWNFVHMLFVEHSTILSGYDFRYLKWKKSALLLHISFPLQECNFIQLISSFRCSQSIRVAMQQSISCRCEQKWAWWWYCHDRLHGPQRDDKLPLGAVISVCKDREDRTGKTKIFYTKINLSKISKYAVILKTRSWCYRLTIIVNLLPEVSLCKSM